MNDADAIQYRVRRLWVRKDNLRLSREDKPWPEPCWTALVLEWVEVHESMRRQGVLTRFLAEMLRQPGYELFIVEAVQNPHLAEALMRWDWDFDGEVMDFYRFANQAVPA